MYQSPQRGIRDSAEKPKKRADEVPPVDRQIHLTAALAGDLTDELAAAYSQKGFPEPQI